MSESVSNLTSIPILNYIYSRSPRKGKGQPSVFCGQPLKTDVHKAFYPFDDNTIRNDYPFNSPPNSVRVTLSMPTSGLSDISFDCFEFEYHKEKIIKFGSFVIIYFPRCFTVDPYNLFISLSL